MGVANERSIAWGIAQARSRAGRRARLHLSGRGLRQAREAAGRKRRQRHRARLRRHRRSEPRRRVRDARRSTGAGSISSSTPSPFPTRNELEGPLCRHHARAISCAAWISPAISFTDASCRRAVAADDRWRQPADPDLFRRRARHAALQRDGRAPRRRSRRACAISRSISAARTSASTRSRPGRSRRWPPRASAISATSCKWNQYNSPLKRNVTHRGGRRRRALSAERSGRGRHRRGASRRLRLSRGRHEGGRTRRTSRSSKARRRGRQQLRHALPLHHLGRKPRAGDRLRRRRRAAADSAGRSRHPALARQAPARPDRASPRSARSPTR